MSRIASFAKLTRKAVGRAHSSSKGRAIPRGTVIRWSGRIPDQEWSGYGSLPVFSHPFPVTRAILRDISSTKMQPDTMIPMILWSDRSAFMIRIVKRDRLPWSYSRLSSKCCRFGKIHRSLSAEICDILPMTVQAESVENLWFFVIRYREFDPDPSQKVSWFFPLS